MSSARSTSEARYREAEELIGDLLAGAEIAGSADLEELVARRQELERELRELWSKCGIVDKAFQADAARAADERARVEAMLHAAAGQSFDERYSIEREVGRGGMGAILRVVDRKLDRPLAMKVIVGQASATREGKTPPIEARQLARFLNEAKITGQLDHPGIVPVHEVGVDAEGRAYFTMKLVKGLTLADAFERRDANDPAWPTQRVLSVIERVCEALAFAHQRGVIHRDLKPTNVMAGDFGEVYVMDWGLARRMGEAEELGGARAAVDEQLSDQLSHTRDGAVIGTPAYMSPEQARGAIAEIGPQSDVYAIGAMLYQLIAGLPPYSKKGEKVSGAEILARVISGPPRRLESRKTPPELIAICEKAMSYERVRRYTNVLELAEDVRRLVAGHTVKALDAGTWAETKKWLQRNPALSGALAGVVVVSLLGAAAFLRKAVEATEARDDLTLKNAELEVARGQAEDNSRTASHFEMLAKQREAEARESEQRALRQLAKSRQLGEFMRGLISTMDRSNEGRAALRSALAEAEGLASDLGDESVDTASGILAAAGQATISTGDFDEAERLLRDALTMRETLFGRDAALTQESVALLALALHSNGRLEEAESLYREACSCLVLDGSDEDHNVLVYRHNWALCLLDLELDEEGLRILRETMETQRARFGEQDPDYLSSLNTLAKWQLEHDQLVPARESLEQLLAARIGTSGDREPETLVVMSNLAATVHRMGEHDAAIDLFHYVVEVRLEELGEEAYSTLMAMSNLGAVSTGAGRLEDARTWLTRAVQGLEATLGPHDEDTLLALANLINAHAKLEAWERVEELAEEFLDRSGSKGWGDDKRLVRQVRGNLALAQQARSR